MGSQTKAVARIAFGSLFVASAAVLILAFLGAFPKHVFPHAVYTLAVLFLFLLGGGPTFHFISYLSFSSSD